MEQKTGTGEALGEGVGRKTGGVGAEGMGGVKKQGTREQGSEGRGGRVKKWRSEEVKE